MIVKLKFDRTECADSSLTRMGKSELELKYQYNCLVASVLCPNIEPFRALFLPSLVLSERHRLVSLFNPFQSSTSRCLLHVIAFSLFNLDMNSRCTPVRKVVLSQKPCMKKEI